MKKTSLLLALCALLVTTGCPDDNNDGPKTPPKQQDMATSDMTSMDMNDMGTQDMSNQDQSRDMLDTSKDLSTDLSSDMSGDMDTSVDMPMMNTNNPCQSTMDQALGKVHALTIHVDASCVESVKTQNGVVEVQSLKTPLTSNNPATVISGASPSGLDVLRTEGDAYRSAEIDVQEILELDAFTIFYVGRLNTGVSGSSGRFVPFSTTPPNSRYVFEYPAEPSLRDRDRIRFDAGDTQGSRTESPQDSITSGQWVVASATRQQNQLGVYTNGTAVSLSKTEATSNGLGGRAVYALMWGGQADVGEVFVVKGALSATDRQNIEMYLATKWGVTLPSNTKCQDSDNNNVCDDAQTNCIDKDGDGVGVANLDKCPVANLMDTDDTDPRKCADTDNDQCDDCNSGYHDTTYECCTAFPVSTTPQNTGMDIRVWIDASCDASLTLNNGALSAVDDRGPQTAMLQYTQSGTNPISLVMNGGATGLNVFRNDQMGRLTSDQTLTGLALFGPSAIAQEYREGVNIFYTIKLDAADVASVPNNTMVSWNAPRRNRLNLHAPISGQFIYDVGTNTGGRGRTIAPMPGNAVGQWVVVGVDARQGITVNGTTVTGSNGFAALIPSDQSVLNLISGVKGDVGEVIVTRGFQTPETHNAIIAYLRAKWVN